MWRKLEVKEPDGLRGFTEEVTAETVLPITVALHYAPSVHVPCTGLYFHALLREAWKYKCQVV